MATTPGAGPSRPLRQSTRSSRRSIAAASTPATPTSSAGPLTPADPNPPAATPPLPSSSSRAAPKNHVEPKAHGLRNSHQQRERQSCPYPQDFGGKEQCGITEEDEADEVLMAVCGACAVMVSHDRFVQHSSS